MLTFNQFDSKKRSDPQFSVGIMDTISIPEEKLFYRLLGNFNWELALYLNSSKFHKLGDLK